MNLAGKYNPNIFPNNNYVPDIFPHQGLMHSLAKQTNDPELKNALLDFQYPFKVIELKNSGYSPQVINKILEVTTGTQQ